MKFAKIILGIIVLSFYVNYEQSKFTHPTKISLVNLGKVDNSKIEFVKSTLENARCERKSRYC